MATNTAILIEAIKQQIPSATFDTTTDAGYVRVGFNRAGLSDPTILSDIFKYAAAKAECEFDCYDEDGAACFIV